jgi:hypothetical protein
MRDRQTRDEIAAVVIAVTCLILISSVFALVGYGFCYEQWKEEAMRAAGLDWRVGLKPVYCMGDGFYYEIPDKKAIVRLDKWGESGLVPFGLVGNDYKVLQNHEASCE